VTGPIVRIDFFSFSPTEVLPNGQPKPVFRQRIVMPVDGFQQFFGLMEQAMQRLTARSPEPDASSTGQGHQASSEGIDGAAHSASGHPRAEGARLYAVSGAVSEPNPTPETPGRMRGDQAGSEREPPTPDYPLSPNFS
jgi:hypothetical protein